MEDMENRNNHKNQKTVKTASANFVGKESNESTVMYGVKYRIPSCCLRSAAVFTLICFLGIGEVLGADVTYIFESATNNPGSGNEWYSDDIDAYTSWIATKGTTYDPKYYDTGKGLRVYNGGMFSISSTKTISSITLTFSGSDYTFSTSNTTTPQTVSPNSTSYEWSVSRTCRLQKIEITYAVATPYTVRFYTASGIYSDIEEASAGAGVTPPVMSTPCEGWAFQGWSKSQSTSSTSTTELTTVTLTAGKYYPSANTTLYPVYTKVGTIENEVSDEITQSTTGLCTGGKGCSTSYTEWSNKSASNSGHSDAVYAGQSNKGVGYIQIRSDSPSGIISTTSGGTLKSVSVVWSTSQSTTTGRTLTIYGRTTAYPNGTNDLSDSSKRGTNLGTIVKGTSTALSDISGSYSYVGLKTNGAAYFDKIIITWTAEEDVTYYYSYPTCCTSLGTINGSVKVISGTSATLQWDDLSGVDGTTPYSVSVSPSEGTSVGGISTVDGRKNCTISGLTAGTEYTFTINAFGDGSHCDKSQDVVATTPKITLGSASGTSTYIEGSGSGSKQTFNVNAVGLTGNLTVTAPTNFAVCATESGSYTSSITLTPTSGAVSTTVYFQLVAGKTAAASPYAGNITVSGGSATEQTVAVNGTVSVSCEDPTITVQPAVSASYNMNVIATPLSVTATRNGTGPALTYQWYSNTANSKTTPEPTLIDDATSASYTPLTTATGTKYYFCEVSSGACAVTSNISAITVNTPALTVSETARAFGDRKKDGSYTMTFTVSGSNLAQDAGISLALSGTNAGLFSIDRTSLSATSNAVATTTITVTYSPNAVGSHSAQIDITSTGATTKTVALSGTGRNEYTITFNDNGSITTEKWLDQSVHATPSISACKSKYSVLGWTTTSPTSNAWASAPSVTAAGNNITVTGNATYYAVYTEEGTTPTDNYRKITSQSELISGREYVITNTGDSYALNCTYFYSDYSFGKTSISPSAGVLTTTTAAMIFTITGNTSEGYSIFSAYDGGYGIGYGYVEEEGKDTLAAYNNPFQDWKITVNDGGNTYIQPKEALYDYFYFDTWWWLKNTATANHLYRRVFNTTYISNPDCRTLESIAVKAEPETNYCEGDWLDMSDLVITATYTDASTEDIDYASNVGDFTFSPSTSTDLTSSNTSVTITYGGKSTSQTISVGTLRTITLTGSGTVANGTISADKSSACAGETVTLTATPDTHYSLSSWTVTKTGDPSTTVTVTDGLFTMPDYNVTVDATISENAYRMVVFQNDGVATFDDGGDASAVDATNKWKQKVYVGEAPVWPTKLTDVTDACDATSNKFYGWATNTWSDVLADADALTAWDGGTVYTSGPLADVTAGTGDVVYHAVWAEASGSNGTISIDESGLKSVVSTHDGTYAQYDFTLSDGDNDYTITASKAVKCTDSGTAKGWPQIKASTGIQIPTLPGKITNISSSAIRTTSSGSVSATAYFNSTASTTSPIASCSMSSATSFSMDINTSASSGYLLFGSAVTLGQLSITYDDTEYSNFLTSCCDKKVTLSEPVITDAASSGSTVTYTESSAVATCDGAKEVHVTITPAAGYQATSISFGGTATQTGVSPALSTPLTSAQTYTISYAQDISGTLVPSVTFEKKTATAWEWKYNGEEIPDPLVLYVGINKQLGVTYEPADLLNTQKNYTVTKTDAHVAQGGKAYDHYTMRGAAGVTTETNSTVTFSLNGLSQTVNVTVKPQPRVHFIDIVHGESFADVGPAVESYVATFIQPTPTHSDISDPGASYNACERSHLHLVGWIDSTWADAHPSATHEQIVGANVSNGEGTFLQAGADFNVETYNGKTYYAVWSIIE